MDYQTFEKEFERRRPKPARRDVTAPQEPTYPKIIASPRFWVFTVIALGAVILSGIRTSYSLHLLSNLLEPWGWIEAFMGVVIIELSIVGFQVLRIWRKIGRGDDIQFDTKWLGAGIVLATLCAIATNWDGTAIHFNLEWWNAWRGVILSVLLGPSIPILAIIAGEIVGGVMADHDHVLRGLREKYQEKLDAREEEQREAQREHDLAMQEWRKAAYRSFVQKTRKSEENPAPTPVMESTPTPDIEIVSRPVTKSGGNGKRRSHDVAGTVSLFDTMDSVEVRNGAF